MFIGHFQLGDLVPVSVWTLDANETPQLPTAAPVVHVYNSGGTAADARRVPIVDRRNVMGFFQYRINLDADFTAGWYTVMVNYTIGVSSYAQVRQFEILPGGNIEGNGIAMHFFKQAAADFVLMQTDKGTLKRLRNPSVRGI